MNAVLREPLVCSSASYLAFDAELIGADPPLHTASRQLRQPFFSPKEPASLRDFAAARVAELSAEMQARPSFDFILDFVIPLTQSVSAQLLGLTTAERQQLQSSLPGHAYQFGYLNELSDYLTNYFQQPEPGAAPTMMSHLLTLIRAGQLSQATAVSLTKTMWLASITATSMLMSNAAQYLATHPAVAAELRARPALMNKKPRCALRLFL